jgi:uncharacterized protein (DUF2249 family)
MSGVQEWTSTPKVAIDCSSSRLESGENMALVSDNSPCDVTSESLGVMVREYSVDDVVDSSFLARVPFVSSIS